MDGIHDLGGKEGHGAVDVEAPDFRYDWERLQWALSEIASPPGGTIDWWRHGIECMAPVSYLSLPYFEKWCLNELAHFVDQGVFSMEEVLAGQPDETGPAPDALDMDAALAAMRGYNTDFSSAMAAPPVFRVGDEVWTIATPVPGHTRLPAYARGHKGRIVAHHGGHLFPDAGARGVHEAGHLYTVEFEAGELWDTASPDTVCLDLWEAYLVRP